jgi:hypothetical protein
LQASSAADVILAEIPATAGNGLRDIQKRTDAGRAGQVNDSGRMVQRSLLALKMYLMALSMVFIVLLPHSRIIFGWKERFGWEPRVRPKSTKPRSDKAAGRLLCILGMSFMVLATLPMMLVVRGELSVFHPSEHVVYIPLVHGLTDMLIFAGARWTAYSRMMHAASIAEQNLRLRRQISVTLSAFVSCCETELRDSSSSQGPKSLSQIITIR